MTEEKISDGIQSGLQLREISIRRFRSIFEATGITVRQGLTVVAGENDGGKTTFLDAIGFLLGEKSLDDRDICNGASEEEGVEVEGVLVPIRMGGDSKPVTIRACQSRGGKRTAEMQTLVHKSLGARPETMGLPELKEACSKLLPDNVRSNAKQPYVDALHLWLEHQAETDFAPSWGPLPKEVSDLLPKLQVFSSATANDPVSAIQQLVRTQSRILLQSEKYSSRLEEVEKELVDELGEGLQFIEDRISSSL